MSSTPSFAGLRKLAAERSAQERCDLCSAVLREGHRHLIDPRTRQLVCACDPCSILFGGQSEQRFRLIPQQTRYLAGFSLPDELWESLRIPVGMAFFVHSTAAGRVQAMYPGPAGATESLLELEAWRELEDANPVLRELQPDVEALLVHRVGRRDHYLAPIDRCYELVGLIRLGWRGLSGGTEVWKVIGQFFESLRGGARVVERRRRA